MVCPILRCHHRSGSLKRLRTVRTVRTASARQSMTGNEKVARQIDTGFARRTIAGAGGGAFQSATVNAGSCGINVVHRGYADQTVEVGSRYAEAAGCQRLVAVAFTYRLVRQSDLVLPELVLK